jgi:hypothetical protein
LKQALVAKDKRGAPPLQLFFTLNLSIFYLWLSFCDFVEFEDLLHSFSSSELAVQRRDYAAKASVFGRIARERLIEQEKTNKKLIEDCKKLSRDFKLSRAANSDLQKKVSELVVALKRCQDEK